LWYIDLHMSNETLTETNDAKAEAIAMTPEIIQGSMDINHTLETTTIVKRHYGTHYVNPQRESFGVFGIICEVLQDNDAVLARGMEHVPELRQTAIKHSLFAWQIIELAKPKFNIAGMRYDKQVVQNYLSTQGRGKVLKFPLTNEEDTERTCDKPRTKYYLVSSPDEQ
jgi:hypothetical protein